MGHLLHDLVFHPRIAAIASQLLGDRPIRLFHDQFFVKPPGRGGPVAWHQDYSYWTRTRPMNHLTFHIALDDCTSDDIGGLQFIPGSHRWRDAPLPITDLHFRDLGSIQAVLEPSERAAFRPTPASLRVGEMSVHHALSVHGSLPNQSDRARRALVVNVFGDGPTLTTATRGATRAASCWRACRALRSARSSRDSSSRCCRDLGELKREGV